MSKTEEKSEGEGKIEEMRGKEMRGEEEEKKEKD